MNPFPFLLGSPWAWWLVLTAGAGAGYFTWQGYARRANELKAGPLLILKFLRLTGWTLLILVLLQPIYRQFVPENKNSRLTVLIDDSESMTFTDARKGPTRMERVKSALAGEKAIAQAAGSKTPVPAESGSLLPTLAKSFSVQMEAFASATRAMSSESVFDARALNDELKGQGESTDISRALTESLARLKGPDAGGLVLISDGADTARGEIERIAAQYKRLGIPIYAVGVGAADQQDLSILQVRCRRTVSKDTLARVEVDVRSVGLPDGKHRVTITRKGKVVGQPQDIDLKGELGTAVFEFLPDGQGFLEYEATVEPFPGELVTANNTMAFGLVAYSRKLKVLYMEGSMYIHKIYNSKTSTGYGDPMQRWWEHQFLERAITEDLDVEMDFLAKKRDWTSNGDTELDLKTVKEGAFPKTKKELYQYDVIISSDIPYDYFTPEQIQMQVDFVGKHGGGFAMVGGYDAFGEGKYAKTDIDRMLPVEMNAGDNHVDGEDFKWKIDDDAWHAGPNGTPHPLLMVDKDEEKSKAAWADLPQFHGFSKTTRVKPAATLLAFVADENFSHPLYGPAILLAVQQYGNGRSMAFTSDTTGSWGTEWEDSWGPKGESNNIDGRNKYYKTFWKNAVRWLAHYRMQAPNQLVRIDTDRLVYGRGEVPELSVKVLNEDIEPTHDAKVTLTITGPDGKIQNVTVFPKYEEPGIYERKLELGGVGRYEIEAVATLGKKNEELGRDKAILQVRPATAEMRQIGQNVGYLKALAEQSGGKYFPLEKIGDLPKSLREATHTIIKNRDNDLLDTHIFSLNLPANWRTFNTVRPWVFALIMGLLCGEWFYRKRNGLP